MPPHCACEDRNLTSRGKKEVVVPEHVLTQRQERMPAEYRIEVVRDLNRFNALASEWQRLVDRCAGDRLFLSHTWFRTWWESFGEDAELYVVTVRNGSELLAAAPMMRTCRSMYGVKLNTIEAIQNPHSPRYDFILANDQDPKLYRALWKAMAEPGIDSIVLTQVPESSNTIRNIEKLAKGDGWLTGQWSPPPSPFIPLNGDYGAFLKTLKGGTRYNLRRRLERLNTLGPVDMEIVTDRDAVYGAMQDGLQIEAAAWKGKQGTAIVSDSATVNFYKRLAESEADLGRLRLSFLRVAGKRIAFNYLLQSQNKFYGVKIGYDPQYHTYSPGNLLLDLILKAACAENIEEYDFLGVDDDWKLEWTKEKREHRWLFVFRNLLPARFVYCIKFSIAPAIKPRLKTLCTYLLGRA
jgi:CelD/BcsL family acetyltransferase involved in cellulose biosynthesis